MVVSAGVTKYRIMMTSTDIMEHAVIGEAGLGWCALVAGGSTPNVSINPLAGRGPRV